jgi:hypothetical protein
VTSLFSWKQYKFDDASAFQKEKMSSAALVDGRREMIRSFFWNGNDDPKSIQVYHVNHNTIIVCSPAPQSE